MRLPWQVQWLRLNAPNAWVLGLIPGQGSRSHMPQLSSYDLVQLNKQKLKLNKKNEIDLNEACHIALSFVIKWEKSVLKKFVSYNPIFVKNIHMHISYKNF